LKDGIKADGTKEFIDFKVIRSENQTQWEGFLRDSISICACAEMLGA